MEAARRADRICRSTQIAMGDYHWRKTKSQGGNEVFWESIDLDSDTFGIKERAPTRRYPVSGFRLEERKNW
jgi:hypothetical protein